MQEGLKRWGVACSRCYQDPGLKDCLGCGVPPTAERKAEGLMWRPDPADPSKLMSPAAASRRGLPAFEGIGYGEIRLDWECCPMWFLQKAELRPYREGNHAVVGGLPTLTAISRAYAFHQQGELSALVPPPWTPGFLDLLNVYSNLESEKMRLSLKKGS